MASCPALSPFFFAPILFCLALHGPSSLFPSVATRDSSRASSIQCSATFSYALLMDGSVACAARCLASSAFRRQASLSDDIRGGSSNAPNQAASRCVLTDGTPSISAVVTCQSPGDDEEVSTVADSLIFSINVSLKYSLPLRAFSSASCKSCETVAREIISLMDSAWKSGPDSEQHAWRSRSSETM